jgi:hypothetical protein
VFNTGSQWNYTTDRGLRRGTLSGSTPGSTFTMPDADVVCTYTNARNARTLTLKKTGSTARTATRSAVTTTG